MIERGRKRESQRERESLSPSHTMKLLVIFSATIAVCNSWAFFTGHNSVHDNDTYPAFSYDLHNGERLELICELNVINSAGDFLTELVVADMTLSNIISLTYRFNQSAVTDEACTETLLNSIKGKAAKSHIISAVQCVFSAHTHLLRMIVRVNFTAPITDIQMVDWGCGAKHGSDTKYTVVQITDLYTEYGIPGLIDPRGYVWDVVPPVVEIGYIPETSDANWVTLSCAVPLLRDPVDSDSVIGPITTNTEISLMRYIEFWGPNGFYVKSDMRGKQWITDSNIECAPVPAINIVEPKKAAAGKHSVLPGDVVSACYDYTGSTLCIEPNITLFGEQSGYYTPPQSNTINSPWMFPHQMVTNKIIAQDSYFDRLNEHTYPTIRMWHEVHEDTANYIYTPPPVVVFEMLKTMMLLTRAYEHLKLVNYNTTVNGFICDDIDGHSYTLLSVAHVSRISGSTSNLNYSCGVQQSFMTITTNNSPLILQPVINSNGTVWERAWCYYKSPVYNNTRTASVILGTHVIDDHHQRRRIFNEQGKYVATDTEKCTIDYDEVQWTNKTIDQGIGWINGQLYEFCKSQTSFCTAHLSRFELLSIKKDDVKCECGQLSNPCTTTSHRRNIMGTVTIKRSDVMRHPNSLVLQCGIFGGKSPPESWLTITRSPINPRDSNSRMCITDNFTPLHTPHIKLTTEYIHENILRSSVGKADCEKLHEIIGIGCEAPRHNLCTDNDDDVWGNSTIAVYTDSNKQAILETQLGQETIFETSLRYFARFITRVSCTTDKTTNMTTTYMDALTLYNNYKRRTGCMRPENAYILYANPNPIETLTNVTILRCYFSYGDTMLTNCPLPTNVDVELAISRNSTVIYSKKYNNVGDLFHIGMTHNSAKFVRGGGVIYADIEVPSDESSSTLFGTSFMCQTTGPRSVKSTNIIESRDNTTTEHCANSNSHRGGSDITHNSFQFIHHIDSMGNIVGRCHTICPYQNIDHVIISMALISISPIDGTTSTPIKWFNIGRVSKIINRWTVNPRVDDDPNPISSLVHLHTFPDDEIESFNVLGIEINRHVYDWAWTTYSADAVVFRCAHITKEKDLIHGAMAYTNYGQLIYRTLLRNKNALVYNKLVPYPHAVQISHPTNTTSTVNDSRWIIPFTKLSTVSGIVVTIATIVSICFILAIIITCSYHVISRDVKKFTYEYKLSYIDKHIGSITTRLLTHADDTSHMDDSDESLI